ncbi:protein HEG homolog 1 [Tachyglossus aculeatus]|uniref:protein HEG homolog 1 n=1 Tax=Tachyglossus aculeatus TaxID=9261 RepID=UPI0018F6D148|nr:protein HEG homolog 1 [Tachyglossus aculeatus]
MARPRLLLLLLLLPVPGLSRASPPGPDGGGQRGTRPPGPDPVTGEGVLPSSPMAVGSGFLAWPATVVAATAAAGDGHGAPTPGDGEETTWATPADGARDGASSATSVPSGGDPNTSVGDGDETPRSTSMASSSDGAPHVSVSDGGRTTTSTFAPAAKASDGTPDPSISDGDGTPSTSISDGDGTPDPSISDGDGTPRSTTSDGAPRPLVQTGGVSTIPSGAADVLDSSPGRPRSTTPQESRAPGSSTQPPRGAALTAATVHAGPSTRQEPGASPALSDRIEWTPGSRVTRTLHSLTPGGEANATTNPPTGASGLPASAWPSPAGRTSGPSRPILAGTVVDLTGPPTSGATARTPTGRSPAPEAGPRVEWTPQELPGVSLTSTTLPSRQETATRLPGVTSAAAPGPAEGPTVPPGTSEGPSRSCEPTGGPDAGDHGPDADPATLRCGADADPTTPSLPSDADRRQASRPHVDASSTTRRAAEKAPRPTRHTGPLGTERTPDDRSVHPGRTVAVTTALHPQTGHTPDPLPGPPGTTAYPGPGPGLTPTQPPPTSLPTPHEQARPSPPPASSPRPETGPPTSTSPSVQAPSRSGPPPVMSLSPEPVSGTPGNPPRGTSASETSTALGLRAVSTVWGSLVKPSPTPPMGSATPSTQRPSPLPTASEETHDPRAFTAMGTPTSSPPPNTDGPPALTTAPQMPPTRTTLTPHPTPTLPPGTPGVAPTPRATPGHPPPTTRPEIPPPMPTARTPAPSASPRPQTETPQSPSTPQDPGAGVSGGQTPAPGAPDVPPAPLTTENAHPATPPPKTETSPSSPTGASTTLDTERAWCLSNPCPAPTLCSPTQGGFVCSCPVGYQMEEGLCRLVRAFVGVVRLSSDNVSAGPGPEGPGVPSGLRRLEKEVRTLLMDLLTPLPGFASCTVRVTREPSGILVVWVQASFSLASSVTVFKLAEQMRAAASSCQPSGPARARERDQATDHYCHRLGWLGQLFQPGSLCRSKNPACDRETAVCSDVDGLPLCRCRDGYFQISEMDHSCRACEDGFRLENQTCVSCPFGLGGLNCGNPYQLVAVVVAAAGGALLLALAIALIITCCRKSKNDVSKLFVKSSECPLCPYTDRAEAARVPPWGREAFEMHEGGGAGGGGGGGCGGGGSTKSLLNMTDVYYTPAHLRSSDPEQQNGQFPAFPGGPGSRHSCVYPGQYNLSFVSDDSRRRDYF